VSTEARTSRHRRNRTERTQARAFWGRRAPVSPAAPTPAWDSFVRMFHRPERVDSSLAYPLPPEYLELRELRELREHV
jgi:hypothetical protein